MLRAPRRLLSGGGLASKAFTFFNTSALHSEVGAAAKMGELLANAPHMPRVPKNVLVVTDQGIRSAGLLDPLVASLQAHGIACSVFSDVVADPPEDVVSSAAAAARASGVDCVIGLGGGSSMDVAKVVALLACKDCAQDLPSLYGVNQCHGPRLPLVQIPTTAGTGSEVTPISILTTGAAQKKGIVSPRLLPDLAVLDAALTVSAPPHVTAATGIDALVHAIEAFTGRLRKNAMSDCFAREAMRLLRAQNIARACERGDDLNVRAELLLGSCYAGMAFANSPVAAVHALAYPIGAQFHVPHGLSNSLVLPHVIRFNAEDAVTRERYQQCHETIFETTASKGGDDFADAFAQLARRVGLPTTLPGVGIQQSDVQSLAENAMLQTRLLPNNPRDVSLQDAIDIYTKAL